MMMHLRSCLAVLLALSLAGCNQADTGGTAGDVAALRAANARLETAVTQGKLDQIMSFYADDAVLMPTAEPTITGKAAIAAEWKHVLAIPDYQNRTRLLRVEVAASRDMAYTMGSYNSRMMGENGKPVEEPGKWLTVWKKMPDGEWRIVMDTYNTDIPPPDHK
jgi:ketosteroid isomerase-like protein